MQTISVGAQHFDWIRENDCFYVDKADFIRQWWDEKDSVTLITRPRRFGKTLAMSMLDCFFSTRHAGRGDLFEGLSIWKEERFRMLQGTWPCIFLSFAGVKAQTLRGARDGIIEAVNQAYQAHAYLKQSDALGPEEKAGFDVFNRYLLDDSPDRKLEDALAAFSLNRLCRYLQAHWGRPVLIFLDEYDTPLQEAWMNGYWDEIVPFIRELFNNTFKTNDYLERAILTGITRVSKESIFSDLNNLKVVTTTSAAYADAFGFTEEEVFAVLEERNLHAQKEKVKFWYDGFCFGTRRGIYNPWSISLFLDSGKFGLHWANTSSNALVSRLIRTAGSQVKMDMETLLDGGMICKAIDEEIVFSELEESDDALWSLLLASGYLRVEGGFSRHAAAAAGGQIMEAGHGEEGWEPDVKDGGLYQLVLTNYEVRRMFEKLIRAWFGRASAKYTDFMKALRLHDLSYMNRFMNQMSMAVFSSFDTGTHPSEAEPERFYHGFVLGLIVDPGLRYHVRSNRESGFGRYDVVLEPMDRDEDAYIFEFKVFDPEKEKDLHETAQAALRQIRERRYDEELLSRGIPGERIRHYGFVFKGKEVLIEEE